MIRKQADTIIAEFARNVAARFHGATAVSQEERETSETPVAHDRKREQEVSPVQPFPAGHLLGMATGLSLAIVFLTTLPLPAAPLLAWSLVGISDGWVETTGSAGGEWAPSKAEEKKRNKSSLLIKG